MTYEGTQAEFRILRDLLLIISAVMMLATVSPGGARIRGGSLTVNPPSTSCPHSAAGWADGCAGANQNATFINPNYFTNMRQSGQGQYRDASGALSNHPPPWDMAGVDYPVGAVTPDNVAIDASTTVIPGCSLDRARRYQRCNAGVNVSGYRFRGIGLFVLTKPVVINDSHFTMTEDNCLSYQGSGQVAVNGGITGDHSVTQSTFDFDTTCRMNADLYKTAYDPGLVKMADIGSVTITPTHPGATVTINGSITGHVRKNQYLDCAGCHTGYVNLTNFGISSVPISSITIAGNIATVTTSSAHGLAAGTGLAMYDQASSGYGGLVEILDVPSSTTFRYIITSGTIPSGPATAVGSYGITYYSGSAGIGQTFNVTMAKRADLRGVTISGTVMHFTTHVGTESIDPGDELIGAGVAPDTLIVSQAAGTNNYNISVSNSIPVAVNMNTYRYTPAVTAVAATVGPVQTSENGPLALASGSSKVTLMYNATLQSGQFASAGAAVDARFNYTEINTQNGQHVNFVFNAPGVGTIPEFREDFNTAAWLVEAEDGGTGFFDYFTASTSSATSGMTIVTELSFSQNTIIANSSNPNQSYNTNSVIRWLSQSGSVPGNVASGVAYSLNSTPGSGVINVTAVTPTSGGTGHLSTDDFIACGGSAPICSKPIRLIAQLTGTAGAPCPDVTCTGLVGTYSTTNTVDTISKSGQGAYKYPGMITQADVNNNYVDITGTQGGAYNTDNGVPVGVLNSAGNVVMTSGNPCNIGSSCIK